MLRCVHLLSAMVIVSAVGCAKEELAIVSGSVTIDGTPAKEGYVNFFPADGRGSTAGGAMVDGSYSATMQPGPKKVEIRVQKVVGYVKLYDTPDSPVQPNRVEVLPPKYHDQTKLVLDAKLGENKQDFTLESAQGIEYP